MNASKHLFLTGYRGTGKSTIGRHLAGQLSRRCVDLDEEIERRVGKTIRQIFDEGGEEAFRHFEAEALEAVTQAEASVIALGGGAIIKEENRRLIAKTGWCCWLNADAETILGRIHGDATTSQRRPALTNLSELEEIRKLLAHRQPLYESASDFRVEVAKRTPEQIADEVKRQWDAANGSI